MLTCTPTISTSPYFLISSSSYPSCLFVLLFCFIVLLYLMECVNLHPHHKHPFPLPTSQFHHRPILRHSFVIVCLCCCFSFCSSLFNGVCWPSPHHKHPSPLPNFIVVLSLRTALLLLVSCVVVIVLYLMECLNKKKNPPYSPIPNPITVSVHFSYVCEAEGMFRGLYC